MTTTTATTTFYMQKLSDPLGNLECTTHHQPPRHNKAGSNEGQIMGAGCNLGTSFGANGAAAGGGNFANT